MMAVDCLEELLRFTDELEGVPSFAELEELATLEEDVVVFELSAEELELSAEILELDDCFAPSRRQCVFSQMNFFSKYLERELLSGRVSPSRFSVHRPSPKASFQKCSTMGAKSGMAFAIFQASMFLRIWVVSASKE